MASKAAQWAAEATRRREAVERAEEALAQAEGALGPPVQFFVKRDLGRGLVETAWATVLDNGWLQIGERNSTRMRPEEALAFSRWILDTFGDDTDGERACHDDEDEVPL